MITGRSFRVEVQEPQISLPPKPPERPVAKALGALILVGVGLFVIIKGLSEASPLARLAIPLLGITILVLFVAMSTAASQPRLRVRVSGDEEAIAFAPPAFIPVLLLLVAAGMVIIAIVGIAGFLTGRESGLPGTGPGTGLPTRFGGVGVMALLGFWAFVDATARLWRPRGLIVSPAGLAWRRYLSRVEVAWDEVANVDLAYERGQLCVVVCSKNGECDTIYTLTTGSDPYVVAETIAFFQHHPHDRGALNDPRRALSALGRVS